MITDIIEIFKCSHFLQLYELIKMTLVAFVYFLINDDMIRKTNSIYIPILLAYSYMGAGRGWKRGGERTRDTAVNSGTRRGEKIERRRLTGGGFGRCTGGQLSVQVKEVGSWCDVEVC